MTRDLELHIEALVLDGMGDADGVRAGEALARELTALIERGASPLLARSRAVDRLTVNAAVSRAQPHASEIGAAVARAVHGGLVR